MESREACEDDAPTTEKGPHQKPAILVIDDSALNRTLLSDILRNDYEVLEAEDGVQALTVLRKHSAEISLVLLDIVMPNMDGFEVLALMHRHGWIRSIPVIIVSSEAASISVMRAYELGVTDFITRPFDANVVRNRVQRTLRLYRRKRASLDKTAANGIQAVAAEGETTEENSSPGNTLELLAYERTKYQFFASLSREVQYEYRADPPIMILSDRGALELNLPELTLDPHHNETLLKVLGKKNMDYLSTHLRNTDPEKPVFQFDTQINFNGEMRWVHGVARAIWSDEDPPTYLGSLGKFIDIHETKQHLVNLQHDASHDSLTGILNHASAREIITQSLDCMPTCDFVLIIVDVDYFKTINDTHGHQRGDIVLKELASRLSHSVRENDIVARIGGDEFLVFSQCRNEEVEGLVKRIFRTACDTREDTDMPLRVSMGAALTSRVGRDYETLFKSADSALYQAKREGRGRYSLHENTDDEPPCASSSIE